jgi:hypothetical protein
VNSSSYKLEKTNFKYGHSGPVCSKRCVQHVLSLLLNYAWSCTTYFKYMYFTMISIYIVIHPPQSTSIHLNPPQSTSIQIPTSIHLNPPQSNLYFGHKSSQNRYLSFGRDPEPRSCQMHGGKRVSYYTTVWLWDYRRRITLSTCHYP